MGHGLVEKENTKMKRGKYAGVARRTVSKAAKKERANREEQRAMISKQYKNEKRRLKNGGMERIFKNEWKKQINEAAREKRKEVFIKIATRPGHNGSLTPAEQALIAIGCKFLEDEGFKVEYDSSYCPTVGSDDPFGNVTVIGLLVSW